MDFKPKLLLPVIFIALLLVGATFILFPGAKAVPEPTHDPYQPPPDDPTNYDDPYYTGDLAGTGFEFYGETTTGETLLITDMSSFNAMTGSVYYGDYQLTNVFVNVYVSYNTEGFVYNDPSHPFTVTAHLGVHDWTAYQIVEGGPSTDKYNLPFSLYGYVLDPGIPTPDPVGTPWCAIRSLSLSPLAITSDDTVTVTASIETGIDYGGEVLNAPSDQSRFTIASATGLSATLQYTVDGQTYSKTMSVSTDFATATIPAQAAGKVVQVKVIADYKGAGASATKSYTVGAGSVPTTIFYWMGEYASDTDRSSYEKLSIMATVQDTSVYQSRTDWLLGKVYFLNPGNGNPYLFQQTSIDAWYEWMWFQVWPEYAGQDLPDEGILRTYLRAYVDIEGYYETATGYETEIIQSGWSSTVGVNLATAPGITAVGTEFVGASSFGGAQSGLPFLPVLLMIVGGLGFVVTFAGSTIKESLGW